ncbi:hypothetical protein N5853_11365 [Bartonella sp. HY329]|uniref:hypothetical protein n=1 Tax=unclassified Bartonella TaxID=2645622 RepID=UPI0021C835A1|nr:MULTISPECIES: hypothetical protein [unclassified Bartonella]UXM94687.1 hypothetical protein N5853_11365 [Bartonella sp. HY329]UXN09010.1 hypothetical protein N5852_11375 [Bartonella sp. HY328]
MFEGGGSNKVNWKVLGNIIYVENDGRSNEYRHFKFINDAPNFYDCTHFAHDELEMSWCMFIDKSTNHSG